MTPQPHPSQVLSSRLQAGPHQVWAHICQTGFIAGYLGASLPAADLASLPLHAPPLLGHDRASRPIALSIHSRLAPTSLSLCLRADDGATLLHLSISACDGGSRLTLLHQPLAAASEPLLPALQLPGGALAPGLTEALAQPLPARLQAGPPDDAAAVLAATAYLADTARLVAWLREGMAAQEGYVQPAAGGFSLVQHLWHLADVEQHGWSQRFERLRREPQPVLPGVDGDRLAVEGRYQQRPWRGAALRFIQLRQRSLRALARCSLDLLRRPVLFSGQPASGAEVLAAMLAHDHEHRLEMAALWPPSSQPGAARKAR